ncbi:MAG: 2-oxo acid dehydrogenase subunit E2 [Methanomassiliicoccales archaeon]|nr:MAG: 2-oxo acid dehydrogenase subunit E2 [Methanomassiliicoccales archaeon]
MVKDFKFPDLGEGITEGEIKKWLVKEGDVVKQDQTLAEVETDKAVVEIPSPSPGKVLRLNHGEGDIVKVGETLAVIGEEGETVGPTMDQIKEEMRPQERRGSVSVVGELPTEEVVVSSKEVARTTTSKGVQATPAVRKLAKDLGVDISMVKGSGPEGRVTESDVRSFGTAEKQKTKVVPKFDLYGFVDRIPIKGVRRTTAKHMMESQQNVAAVTAMDDADITDLVSLREKIKDQVLKEKGVKITYMPFIITAVVKALRDHPLLNSVVDDKNEQIVVKKYYNIGIAVAVDDGLIVPVLKAADQKSIVEIAQEVQNLSELARTRKLDIADLKGGTFTITNYGAFGGTYGTPIINYPEVAILGTGRIMDVPRVVDGVIRARKILPLSLTFDHRALDGAEAAKFLNDLKRHLESPELMLIPPVID